MEPRSSLSLSDRRSWGKYVLAAIIGALATCLVISISTPATTLALSEFDPPGADGVFAIPARLSADAYGLYLIDTQNQTLLLYRYGSRGARGLSLLSARSFRYDRQLLNFNTGKPSPQEVHQLLKTAEAHRLLKAASEPPVEPKGPDAPVPDKPQSDHPEGLDTK